MERKENERLRAREQTLSGGPILVPLGTRTVIDVARYTTVLEQELLAALAVGGSPLPASNEALQCREGCLYPLSGEVCVLATGEMVGRVPVTLAEDARSGFFALASEGGYGPKHGHVSLVPGTEQPGRELQ